MLIIVKRKQMAKNPYCNFCQIFQFLKTEKVKKLLFDLQELYIIIIYECDEKINLFNYYKPKNET